MKKILFVLITLITVSNFSHASFPIKENDTKTPKTIISEDAEKEEPSLFEAILMGFLVVSILGFVSYFVIRAWWRAWREEVKWVRILTYVILGVLLLMLLLVGICSIVKGGCVYNMQ